VGSAPAARSTPTATLAFARAELAGGGLYLVAGGQVRLLRRDAAEPAWSPDGRRLAYVAAGSGGASDLFVIDADGTHAGRITWTANVDETSPSWSPDGKRLVVERSGTIVTVRADGTGKRVLASGWDPAWSPGGRLIAFSNGADLYLVAPRKGRLRRLTSTPAPDSAPAWAPDGRRLAFISEDSGAADVHVLDLRSRQVRRLTQDAAVDASPAFSADGRSVIFVSDRTGVETLWRVPAAGGVPVPAVAAAFAADPAPRPRPRVLELLPDLDQQPPTDLDVRPTRRGFRLWFTAAADNVGLGPLIVNGRRKRAGGQMRANQRVRLTSGRLRTNPEIGTWRYNASPDHSHWHLLHFQRYELRLPGGSVVVRDRKSGFCIGDRYGVAPGRIKGRIPKPVFRGFCNTYAPASIGVDGGTSVGYSDRYHSRLDGQNLDITRVPAGEYLLVHRVNTELLIREFRNENNAASVRIRIAWPKGRSDAPGVRVLRTCPDSDRC
jgi:sugar lactone lactonase YvrE